MATSDVWSYQDLVEHVLDMFDSAREGRPLRMAKRACQEAMRELTHASQWAYFDTVYKFKTVATETDGTITYDHAGGTYDNLLTIADATFPTDARLYTVILGGRHYPISRYIDSTNVVLDPDQNPNADIAAGTGYTLYRGSYPMPADFVELGRLFDTTNERDIMLISASDHQADTVFYYDTPDTPIRATLRNDGEYLNSLSLLFSPPAGSAINYEYMYQRRPKSLLVEKYSTGTVAITGGATLVAITTGTFSTDHIGCLMRFGNASSEPTSVVGGLDDTVFPAVYESVIVSVSSDGTTCNLEQAPAVTMSGVKFTISDPLDVDHGAMLSAIQRLAEAAFTRMTKRDPKERREREELALYALRTARERDNKVRTLGPRFPFDPFSDTQVTDDE